MNSTPVCQGVFSPDGEGGLVEIKRRNCTFKYMAVGKVRVDFLGALSVAEGDLDVSIWCRTNQNVIVTRVANVVHSTGNQFFITITDAAGAASDDYTCGFYTSHVQGG